MSTSAHINLNPDPQGHRKIRGADQPAELLAELGAAGWQGPRVEAFTDDLWLYGWDVLRGLVRNRRIRTIPATMPPVDLREDSWRTLDESSDERYEVVVDTLSRAIPRFLERLEAGKYDPGRSSLGTYFTGQCAIVFRDVAKAWQKRHHREQYELASFDWDGVFGGMPIDDVERRIDLRTVIAHVLREVSAPQRIALVRCLLEDRSHGEVAELMRITPKAVEGHVHRARRAARAATNPEHVRWLLDGDGDPRKLTVGSA